MVGPFLDEAERREPTMVRPRTLAAFIGAHPGLAWAIRPLPDPPVRAITVDDLVDPFDPDSEDWWLRERVERLWARIPERDRARLRRAARERGVGLTTVSRGARWVLVRLEGRRRSARSLRPGECARLIGAGGFRTDAEGIGERRALTGIAEGVCVPAVSWLIHNCVNPMAAELLRGRILHRPGR